MDKDALKGGAFVNSVGVPQPNPQLVALLQGKLGTLVGKSSGYIESLPKEVKRRINGLKFYQSEQQKLELKLQEEILALEKRYHELQKPLIEKRQRVIKGEIEPTDEDAAAGHKLIEEEKQRDGDGVKKEDQPSTITEEPNSNDAAKKVNDVPQKGIPEFWLTAMKNLFRDIITERDEEALKHLIDVRMTYLDRPGFALEFEFEENLFFTNKILTKKYYYHEELGYWGDFVYDHAEATPVEWKEGKNLTITIETKKQKHKGTNKTRVVKTEVPCESFFDFFNPPVVSEEEEDEETEGRLEEDYTMGEEIKEKLIPRAIDWYTGVALNHEDSPPEDDFLGDLMDNHSGDDDEGDDDDDDDDDYDDSVRH